MTITFNNFYYLFSFQIPILFILLWITLARSEPPPSYLPPNGKCFSDIIPLWICKQLGLEYQHSTAHISPSLSLSSIIHIPSLNQILFLGIDLDSDQIPGSSYLPPENSPGNGDEEEYVFYPPGTWHLLPFFKPLNLLLAYIIASWKFEKLGVPILSILYLRDVVVFLYGIFNFRNHKFCITPK